MPAEKAERVFQVRIDRDDDGSFVAECPELPGCCAWASTYEEAVRLIMDAITRRLAEDEGGAAEGPR